MSYWKKFLFSKKKLMLLFAFIAPQLFAQVYPQASKNFSQIALELYRAKKYKESATAYSEAFRLNGWRGSREDRYDAACAWALAGYPDSAFFQLQSLTTKFNFEDYDRVVGDSALHILQKDPRWKLLLDSIQKNKTNSIGDFRSPLEKMLENILYSDQRYREQIDVYEKKYGRDSKEIKELWNSIRKEDEANLKTVEYLLDNFGWLGADIVGEGGNSALFLVIQHSDLAIQQKYLPMMREAVKQGKANARDLALLDDRVALREGKKQIYGSQIGRSNDGKYYVSPIEDEANVNKRRSEVGLGSLEEYAKQWGIEYKSGANNVQLRFWQRYWIWAPLTAVIIFIATAFVILFKKQVKGIKIKLHRSPSSYNHR